MSQRQPLLEIDSLSVSFPGVGKQRTRAVRGVDLTIYPGQTVAVVGESGSGKSVTAMSTLQLIATPPGSYDAGEIRWRSDDDSTQNLLKLSQKQMRAIRGNQIAMIFQEPMTSLNPVYTIGEQIMEAVLLHQSVSRKQATEIAISALRDVGIADPEGRLKTYPHQLSGGMRQRVMIAMALACQPRLLLADEPTTALDVTIQAQILELLRKLQRERDMAILLITHDLGVVAENADVVAVMYAGRVVEFADVQTLFSRPLHPYTRGLLASMPVLGQHEGRLGTVSENATIPDDLPVGVTVQPHMSDPSPDEPYGGADAKLHRIEDNHWVLCEIEDSGDKSPARPALDLQRDAILSTN
jgi:oligopeptide/dipeptide ABC transporter ATP-binding protein